VVSHRNACFMNNEISGIAVDEQIIRMYEGKNREEGENLAVTISAAIAEQMKNCVDGYYLMTPFQRVELMCRIMEKLPKE
jgi:homocysteine S-methyltransferase